MRGKTFVCSSRNTDQMGVWMTLNHAPIYINAPPWSVFLMMKGNKLNYSAYEKQ